MKTMEDPGSGDFASPEPNGPDEFARDNRTGTNHGALYPNSPLKYLTASSIMADAVHNEAQQHIGYVKDLMINLGTGAIEYVVIEFGGFLGMGTKYFAIPFRLLTVDAEKKSFIFKEQRETLAQAPGFDIDHWPDTNIHLEKVFTYWSFMGSGLEI